MTGVGNTTDRATKWMRRIARALALIWAGLWTICIIALVHLILGIGSAMFGEPTDTGFVGPTLILFVLPVWVSVAIAWRREAIGGVALVLVGLFLLVGILVMFRIPRYVSQVPGLLVLLLVPPLPPLVAGILFLASWWRSRRAGSPQNSA